MVFAPIWKWKTSPPRTPANANSRINATEPLLKKKIRAVQYGVGPIGAAIVRLMREKESIEIIGAIDSDPTKAGRDLGDVVDGADAPWGGQISRDAEAMLAKSPDVVIHSTTSYLPGVMD